MPMSGRYSGKGNGNPLQYSCWDNPMDRGAGPWDRKESDMTEYTHEHFFKYNGTFFTVTIKITITINNLDESHITKF